MALRSFAPIGSSMAFQETRINLEPRSETSIVTVKVSSQRSSRPAKRRLDGASKYSDEEREYRAKCLATASSIYHRNYHDSPRSFLWRLLDNDTVLSLSVADICKSETTAEASLTLHLRFPNPLRASCIALVDTAEHDALSVFVLDETNQLYGINLRPDHFRKRALLQDDFGQSIVPHHSSTFGFKHPHRMVATSRDQVIVTLHDGGLIRFDRNKSGDPHKPWTDTVYTSQGWSKGLRNLIPFQGGQTIRYGSANMELSAATAVAADSKAVAGTRYLYTVCLDHKIRIWDIQTGVVLYTGDMLNDEKKPQSQAPRLLDPSSINLIRVLEQDEDVRVLVTYSPIGDGAFKFWRVETKKLDNSVYVHDRFAKVALVPPAPSGADVWTLTDFDVSLANNGTRQLWVLWKNNLTYRTQTIAFGSNLTQTMWDEGWKSVHMDRSIRSPEPSSVLSATDPTEKWLSICLYPGRFTKATLETAVALYGRGAGTTSHHTQATSRSLAESICQVLGSTMTLEKGRGDKMEYDQFQAGGEMQWKRFHRLLVELDKQRGEALSLTMDPVSGMAWIMCSDLVACIRESTTLDQYWLSDSKSSTDNTAALVAAGLNLYSSLPESVLHQCNAALRCELFEDSSASDSDRMRAFFDRSGIWRQISDEDASQVVEFLGENFQAVTERVYSNLFDLFLSSESKRAGDDRLPLTDFGRRLVVTAVQETAHLHRLLLVSQLILLVHIDDEIDDDSGLSRRVDVAKLYRALLEAMKRVEYIQWLSSHQLDVHMTAGARRSSITSYGNHDSETEDRQQLTAFEVAANHVLGLINDDREPLASKLTSLAVDICSPASSIEIPPALFQCALIKMNRSDLALDLHPFCGSDPFEVYIQGRVSLSLRDYRAAALCFKKAAIGMSASSGPNDRHSSGLLDSTDWQLLNSGLANYYRHIVGLFDRQKAPTYVIDFARLALQFCHTPAATATRFEMLSRLFAAALATASYELAHGTLLSMTDRALQHSCLRQLVEQMCESGQATDLSSLPFTGLEDAIDEILHKKCQVLSDANSSLGTQYHKILYASRIVRGNYRGAASVLYQRLQRLKQDEAGGRLVAVAGDDVLDTPVTRQYLMLINALSCVDPKQAWIAVEPASLPAAGHANGSVKLKRSVVTLAEIRKEYEDELDRIAAIDNNQFGFAADDEIMVDA